MIVYPLDFPSTVKIKSVDLYIQRNQTSLEFLNGQTQTHFMPGDKLRGSVALSVCTESDARTMRAFLISLNGMLGTFKMPAAQATPVRGAGVGASAMVRGAQSGGNSILTDGWPVSSKILLGGDVIRIGSVMRSVVFDVWSDASGIAEIPLAHNLTGTTADNAIIGTAAGDVWGTFRLSRPDFKEPIDERGLVQFAPIEVEEVI